MTALVINCIIGGGIFGLPGELNRLLGRASPLAVVFAAAGVGVIMACAAEVASQFSEPGGPFLYVRTAFGRFLGMQIGWMELLSVTVGTAALSNLFVDQLLSFLGRPLNTWERSPLMAILIAIPAVANYRGIRSGAMLSNLATVAKLAPLLLLIGFGVARFAHQPVVIHVSEITSPGMANWLRAMVFLVSALNGWDDSVVPTGEMKEPRRTIPFGLGAALAICAVVYMLLQFTTVASIGTNATATPLADAASLLMGTSGGSFVKIAALVSIYGWISAAMLYSPRLIYSLAAQGDFPSVFAKLHPRFQTPAVAIVFYSFLGWALASAGAFLWLMAVGAGTSMVMYASMCCSLIRLRKIRPNADAWRIPFAPVLSIVGVAISLLFIAGLERREVFLMSVTALFAAMNWLWVRRRPAEPAPSL